jgi:hypothetical protein
MRPHWKTVTVPKIAVDEYHDLLARKNDVGLAR